jgi:hypothetical protein
VTVHQTPITVIQNATVFYDEDGEQVRYEGKVELYEPYVRLASGLSTWVPREQVEQVIEA